MPHKLRDKYAVGITLVVGLLAVTAIISGLFVIQDTLTVTVPTQEDQTVTYNESIDSDWHENADMIVWVAGDSQPDPGDENNDFPRLKASVKDLHDLGINPDYAVLPGDISDVDNVASRGGDARENAIRTRKAYERLSFISERPRNSTLYVEGNHEDENTELIREEFGGDCTVAEDNLVEMNTSVNVKFIGACGDSQTYDTSFPKMNQRLDTYENSSADWNVFTTFHQPLPGTTSNCHALDNNRIYGMSSQNRQMYTSIIDEHGSGILTGTITAHLHGRHSDRGQSVNRTGPNHTVFQSPIFGGGITYSTDSGTCDGTGRGVGDSMFITFENGSDIATAYIRHSCDDYDSDGNCDTNGYWAKKFKIPLSHPVTGIEENDNPP